MPITVEVIFWGLIGLTPGPATDPTMYALLAEHPGHAPRVWLLEGECSGNCEREPATLARQVGGAGLPRPVDTMGDARFFPLRWWLDEEHLQLVGGPSGVQAVRDARPAGQRFPANAAQSRDLSWIPHLEMLTSGLGEVRGSCLGTAADCPISARFHIQGGELTACHLLHEENARLELFHFQDTSGDPVRGFDQAVADAALLRFQIPASQIVLESWNFSRSTRNASAVLTPRVPEGTVRLLIGNWPSPYPQETPQPEPHPGHFRAFYGLLPRRPAEQPVRARGPMRRFETGHPGLCEVPLIEFEEDLEECEAADATGLRSERAKLGKKVIPHLSTECDMTQTAPPQ